MSDTQIYASFFCERSSRTVDRTVDSQQQRADIVVFAPLAMTPSGAWGLEPASLIQSYNFMLSERGKNSAVR